MNSTIEKLQAIPDEEKGNGSDMHQLAETAEERKDVGYPRSVSLYVNTICRRKAVLRLQKSP